ncbi:MAG TPA: type II toxin-antitoxin system HicA family toxin [Acidobacteriaceae bacterium]
MFESIGWEVRRESNHIVMTHRSRAGVTISIPNHKEVKRETLKSIVRVAGYTDKQYRLYFDAL